MAHWRNMTEADLDGVSATASAVHPKLPERTEVFARRLQIFPEGCWVLVSDVGIISGYAIAHPIKPFYPPELDVLPGPIAPDSTQYYIHDIAIAKEFRGNNFAQTIIKDLLRLADGYESCSLVSVYETRAFWERFGFQTDERNMSDRIAPYGEGAVFMTRQNTSYPTPDTKSAAGD